MYVAGHVGSNPNEWVTLKLSATGQLQWERRLGGPGSFSDDLPADVGLLQRIAAGGDSIDVDPSGGFHVAGFAFGTGDASLVWRFDAAGDRLWQTRLTFASGELPVGPDIAAGSTGEVTVAGTIRDLSFGLGDCLTVRLAADGRELFRHRFDGRDEPGGSGSDAVAGLAIAGGDAAVVTGTSWNGSSFDGGTFTDIVTLRFAPGGTPPPDPPATPAAPSQLQAAAGSNRTTFAQVAVVGPNTTSFFDSGLARNTTYRCRVRACNARRRVGVLQHGKRADVALAALGAIPARGSARITSSIPRTYGAVAMRAAAVTIALGAALAVPATAAGQAPQIIRFDGGAYDRAAAIVTDGAGNTFVGGSAESAVGASPFVVVKLGPDGARRWTARYDGARGGVGGEAGAVAVDAAGNVYAAGYVHDGVIFNQNYDYLVVKFGPDGSQRWAQRYNGPGNNADFATAVAVDGSGNVHVTGYSYGQGYDWATLKFAPDGALRWERRLSGPGTADDRAADMALLPDGNLVVGGTTQNTGDRLTNDAETVAYDPAGGIAWRARWTDTTASHEAVLDLDVDAAGRIAITGTTAENASPYVFQFPVTLRYDRGGGLLQTIRNGGSSVDVDPAGNVYLAGFFIEPADSTADSSSVVKHDAAGSRVWATPLTVGANEFLADPHVAADSTGAVTVAGTLRDLSIHQSDYLVIRLGADGRELWRYRFTGVNSPGQQDEVAGVAIDAGGAALVTGTSWNDYVSSGGTATDIVTLKFGAGATPALLAPSQLDAAALSRSQIRLNWRDNAGTEDGFRIERCAGIGCTSFTQIAVVGHDVTSYVDGGLARNTAYSYRVRAFNAGGVSPYSNTATAKTRRH